MNADQDEQLQQLFGGAVVPNFVLGRPLELRVNGVVIASARTFEEAVKQATRKTSRLIHEFQSFTA